MDGVLVDGERVAAVLELVLDLDRLARELAELAHGDEARAQLMREGATKDESPGLDADHHFDALALVMGRQQVDDAPKGGTVLEQGRDVLEEDAFGRKVLDVPDLRAELSDVVHRAGILPVQPAAHKAEGQAFKMTQPKAYSVRLSTVVHRPAW